MYNKRKGNKNGKGIKNKFKPKNETSQCADVQSSDTSVGVDRTPNDLGWYVPSEQILNDSARIPYSIPVGMPFSRIGTFPTLGDVRDWDDAMPGILVAHVMPSFGNAKTASDAVNVAANSMYQFVRSRISGSRPYDAVDFLIYMGAIDSIFTEISWLTRAYSTAYTYHQSNRYLSRAILEAQGFDYDDFISHLPELRTGLNIRIEKIKSLYVPSVLPIFRRHSWLFTNYFIEGDSEKDQIYLYNPDGYYTFELDSLGAGMLKAHAHTTPMTVAEIFTILDSMIDPVFADEDFNRISGDLMKAYEGNVLSLTSLPDITTIGFSYTPEVLLQFKNAKFKHVTRDGNAFANGFHDLHQSEHQEYLITDTPIDALMNYRTMGDSANWSADNITASSDVVDRNATSTSMYEWSKNTLLTSPSKDVLPGENMINTRLTIGFDIEADDTSWWKGKINNIFYGSEWPDRFSVWTYHRNRSTQEVSLIHRIFERTMYLDVTFESRVYNGVASQIPILTAFKYMPEITIMLKQKDVPVQSTGRSLFEVDNYALIGPNVLQGLHTTAILGEYRIPSLAISK